MHGCVRYKEGLCHTGAGSTQLRDTCRPDKERGCGKEVSRDVQKFQGCRAGWRKWQRLSSGTCQCRAACEEVGGEEESSLLFTEQIS
jgi:hypothetical protein